MVLSRLDQGHYLEVMPTLTVPGPVISLRYEPIFGLFYGFEPPYNTFLGDYQGDYARNPAHI